MQDLSREVVLGDVGRRIAVFGGVYNNYLSLGATLQDARARGAELSLCLGDMGGFGPHPDRVFPLLRDQRDVLVMQGNYDHSIGNRLEDCACGYTDPRDNAFAQISYDYTDANTLDEHKDWLRDLPTSFRITLGTRRVLCAHGSPRKVNEFMWASTCSDTFLSWLLERAECDVLCVTHTGIPWIRRLAGGKVVVNVGAIGRPANRATTKVDYAMLWHDEDQPDVVRAEIIALDYDHVTLAAQMRQQGLPEEFAQTILTGYWTTCLEILPAKERDQGIY